jgi:hypothetical protein
MQTMHIGIGFDRLFGNILSAGIYELESWDHGWSTPPTAIARE